MTYKTLIASVLTAALAPVGGCQEQHATRSADAEIYYMHWDTQTFERFDESDVKGAFDGWSFVRDPTVAIDLANLTDVDSFQKVQPFPAQVDARLVLIIRLDDEVQQEFVADRWQICRSNLSECRENDDEFRAAIDNLMEPFLRVP